MASIAITCRCSARAAARRIQHHAQASRGLTTSGRIAAAQNFTMPALSPTMTEGNITSWKVKEGDSFSAGDVILEVETDKATMDVEAQDDGILAKITQPDNSKAVKVGSRIAVLAEPGDDLSSLEIPPEEDAKTEQKEGKNDAPAPTQAEPPPSQQSKPGEKPDRAVSERGGDKAADPETSEKQTAQKTKKTEAVKGKTQNKKYPLYPSVAVLLHTHDISADDITATGPGGRLLKGDVLAYLDRIPSTYSQDLADRLEKRSHLDLSNIKVAEKKVQEKDAKAESQKGTTAAAERAGPPPKVPITMPISMAAVLRVQKRLQDTLGVSLPLSTFVARAVDLANEDLPARSGPPTADELFDAVVGVDKVRHATKGAKGTFMPQIIALPPSRAPALTTSSPAPPRPRRKTGDIFDQLASNGRQSASSGVSISKRAIGAGNALGSAENIFTLSVDEAEAKRARVFLQRVKTVLEADPGTLVL